MSCVSAFCNILQNFNGEIFGIFENVTRFLKYVFDIPDEQQLELASLRIYCCNFLTLEVIVTSIDFMPTV